MYNLYKKRGNFKIFLINLTLIFMIGFGFASVNIYENSSSIKTSYSPQDIISGKINISITNENLNSILSSNFEGNIYLKDLLDNNSVIKSCNPSDCSNGYELSDSGENSKTISIDNKKYFGFYIEENNIDIINLSFDISSNFGNSNTVPLELQFFDRSIWQFKNFSTDYTRSRSYGCYSSSSQKENINLNAGRYCEKVTINETNSILVGAEISGTDTKQLTIRLFDSTLNEKGYCALDSSNSCIINFPSLISNGNYYACLETNQSTNFLISSEVSGEKCGWYQQISSSLSIPSSSFPRDYGIFAATPKYSASVPVKIDTSSVRNIVSDANSFIRTKYNGNCSSGCILPISVSGVPQNFVISNINLIYSLPFEPAQTMNKVYNINDIPSKVDFSGILDLSYANFNVGTKGNKTFMVYFNGIKKYDKKINVLAAPTINSIFPRQIPAGIKIKFNANVNSEKNITSYSWNFGDGTTESTTKNEVSHIYKNISIYSLTLNVTDSSGITSSKSFEITSTSPNDFVPGEIKYKKNILGNFSYELSKFPTWYKQEIEKIMNLSFYQSELQRLERKINNSYEDKDFLEVALDLASLNIPSTIYSDSFSFPLITNLNDIKPDAVQIIAGGSEKNLDDYKNAIFQWQRKNIESTILLKKIYVAKQDSEPELLLLVYFISVKSNADSESYFVIQKQLDQLQFNNMDARKAGDSSVIILEKGSEKSMEFYFFGNEEAVIYVSPKLSLLPLDVPISPCNFNEVCEKNKQETVENCASDCKPWGRIILYISLAFLFFLILYTILQEWYKAKYETSLFKDRRQLFNLVMFITNARTRGIDENEIKKILKQKNWSNEKITYAIKKSKGQRTGMYEIIPIEKLFSFFRERRARKNIATQNMQQGIQNINKSSIQGINKW